MPGVGDSLATSPPKHDPGAGRSVEDGDNGSGPEHVVNDENIKKDKPPAVGWRDLPKKSQLLVLVCARFAEPLTMSSSRAYLYYQLKWFDPSLSDSTISWQAGLMASAFTFAQFLTGMLWGRAADDERIGRKNVLLISLFGTGMSCLGYGFARSFYVALFFRFMAGVLNGEVGVMRTMINEMVAEKRYQSRAFMLMPMINNVGQLIGPLIGGIMAEPVKSLPWLFGPDTFFGGKNGVQWMIDYPYALPNILSAGFIIASALFVILNLEETHYMLRDQPDWGIRLARFLKKSIWQPAKGDEYTPLLADEHRDPQSPNNTASHVSNSQESRPPADFKKKKRRSKLPFSRIFTRNVIIVILARALMAMHIGTFQNLWFVFLSTPREDGKQRFLGSDILHFSGGLSFEPSQIGVIMSILGGIGVTIQVFVFPWVQHKFGTVTCMRASIMLFPIVYFVTPFLVLLPSTSKPPLPSAGFLVWAGILTVLGVHVLGRVFSMPSATILVNNCCPHPSVLSTIHGAAQSVASLTRMIGPLIGGIVFGVGLEKNIVWLGFWVMAGWAIFGALFALLAKEGSGHEIVLDDEDDEEEPQEVGNQTSDGNARTR